LLNFQDTTGASFGVMTALMGKLVGDTGRVISFEPNPRAIELSRLLFRTNAIEGIVHLNAMLVGDRSSPGTEFFVVPGYESVSSTRNTEITKFHPNAERREIPMVALDDYDFRGAAPAVLKVDVEGSEYLLLEGARRVITSGQPDLVMETHALEIDGIGGNLSAVCQQLERFGYALFDLQASRLISAADYAETYARKIGYLLASKRMDIIVKRLAGGVRAGESMQR
jgi:FkbM family methyltransferase